MIHHFPFDPRVILGVPAEASLDEVREAYREKSKKHHPDLGGDEWAFRMVVRAYEVLKSTAGGFEQEASVATASARTAGASTWADPPPWSRAATASGFFNQGRFPFGNGGGGTATSPPETASESESPPEAPRAEPPGVFQTVEVELVWIRFDMAEKSEHDLPGAAPADSFEGPTLSVCMVVSWPLRSLVSRASEYANLGETLRHVIEAFEGLPTSQTLAVRSRIEDGQFVGWASFPDVLAAQSGFLALRENLQTHDLTVHLQTRDEIIPPSWAG